MKTKILIALLFCVTNLFAQTNLYTETKVFNEGAYSYQCNVSSVGNVYLYNTSNSWIGLDQKFKSTNANFVFEDQSDDLITHDSWLQNRAKLTMILRNAISSLDSDVWTRNGTLYINFYVNTNTGKVDDVRFYFDRNSSYVYLPISFYRQLELTFKEQYQYVLTDVGSSLNYVYQWETF